MAKVQRKSGIELLRIIAMLQIITLHVFNFGKLTNTSENIGGIYLDACNLLWAFCRSPVNVFMVITGYFLVEKPFDLRKTGKRILSIYKTVIFYSLFFTALGLLIAHGLICKDSKDVIVEILKGLTPLTSRTWYFISNYIIVLSLSPFINTAVQKATKKQYLTLLCIVFFVVSLWPVASSLKPLNRFISVKNVVSVAQGKSVYQFVLMYLAGGYLKRFVPENNKVEFKYLFMFLFCCFSDFALNYLSSNAKGSYSDIFGWYSNPLVVFEGVFVFLFFRSLNFESRFINRVSKGVFGVYMIHEFRYIRSYIWSVFNFKDKNISLLMTLVNTACMVLCVFVICNILEQIRLVVFNYLHKVYSSRKKTKNLS